MGRQRGQDAVPDFFDRLKTALADRYAIEHEIGAGGMATVYLARDLKHGRQVAVKVLRPELAAAVVLIHVGKCDFDVLFGWLEGTRPLIHLYLHRMC